MKVLIIVFALTTLPATAETTIICPHQYPTQLLNAKPPPEWEGLARARGPWTALTYAGVLAGDPLEWAEADQKGEEKKVKGGIRVTYSSLSKFNPPQPKWAYCQYGIEPTLQLLKEIPAETDVCIADIHKEGKSVADIVIKCH